jgi:hypothetical protein
MTKVAFRSTYKTTLGLVSKTEEEARFRDDMVVRKYTELLRNLAV